MLDDMDRSILDFERAWTFEAGPKDRIIEFTLGLTAEAYYRRLRELILDNGARTYDPLTVRRLQRFIDAADGAEAIV